jgi:hypothetical protein
LHALWNDLDRLASLRAECRDHGEAGVMLGGHRDVLVAISAHQVLARSLQTVGSMQKFQPMPAALLDPRTSSHVVGRDGQPPGFRCGPPANRSSSAGHVAAAATERKPGRAPQSSASARSLAEDPLAPAATGVLRGVKRGLRPPSARPAVLVSAPRATCRVATGIGSWPTCSYCLRPLTRRRACF